MTDPFALFDERPQPHLDAELLKAKFLACSAECHPDKAATPEDRAPAEQEFAALNAAYTLLRQPRTRLLHLLKLSGNKPDPRVQSVPAEVAEMFPAIAAALSETDALLRQKAAAASPMLKVQLLEPALGQTAKIQELQGLVAARLRAIDARLEKVNPAWLGTEPPSQAALDELKQAAAALAFLERWAAQLNEKLAALAF